MLNLRHFLRLMCVWTLLLIPAIVSAHSPVHPETRVGAFEVAAEACVRLSVLAISSGHKEKLDVSTAEAVGYPHATKGALALSTAQKGALMQAGLQPFKNSGLTVAGRALTKHPELVGLTKATLNQTLRSPGAINSAAEGALGSIPQSGTATVRELGRFGLTTEIRAASGFGARFSQATGEFIGFITP